MTPADARTEFLRSLPEDEFAPSEERVAAVAAATGVELPRSSATNSETARAVEAFAAEFWSLPSDARRARWDALRARPAAPAVAARLQHLARGLDLSALPHPDAAVEAVAVRLRDGFVLPPRERAVARSRWLSDLTPEARAAADRLRAESPELAALDPLLSDPAVPASPPQRFPDEKTYVGREADQAGTLHRTAHSPRIDWDDDHDDRSWHPDGSRTGGNRSSRRKVENAAPAEGSNNTWGIWATVAVVAIVVRAMIALVPKSDPSPGRYSPPDPTPPPIKWNAKNPNPMFNITNEELLAIALYDPASGKPPPPKMGLARLAGITEKDLKTMREKYQAVIEADREVKRLSEELERLKKQPELPPPNDR